MIFKCIAKLSIPEDIFNILAILLLLLLLLLFLHLVISQRRIYRNIY